MLSGLFIVDVNIPHCCLLLPSSPPETFGFSCPSQHNTAQPSPALQAFWFNTPYSSSVALPKTKSAAFQHQRLRQTSLTASVFGSSSTHGAPTELCQGTSEFTTDLKITPFQKHQLLHNWKLKLLTSLGLFFLRPKPNLCSKGIIFLYKFLRCCYLHVPL